jgi:serine/threonine-protein kinase
MRFVPGGDLGAFVSGSGRSRKPGQGPLQPAQAVAMLSPVASALDAAHRENILHRDVKPGNILIDRLSGRVPYPYLSDFGLAKNTSLPSLTGTGKGLGSPSYSAPEQLKGEKAGPAADEYGLACVAFYILTGQAPFQRDTLAATLWAQVSGHLPHVTEHRPELPAAVDQVLARALAVNPVNRYLSCREFTSELGAALGVPAEGSRYATARPVQGGLPAELLSGGSARGLAGVPVQAARRGPRHAAPRRRGRWMTVGRWLR